MFRVSVIIPTYNEERVIADCLEGLLRQNYPDFEILVIDGYSEDNTVNIVKQFMKKNKCIRLFFEKGLHKSPANARNRGIQQASGEILIFKDADSKITDDSFITNLVEPFSDPEVGVVYANYVLVKADSFLEECLNIKQYGHRLNAKELPEAFRKHFVEQVGGFDPNLGYGEDVDLVRRVLATGCKRGVARNPIEIGTGIKSFKEFIRRGQWYGNTLPDYLKKYRGDFIKLLAPFVYFSSIAGLIIGLFHKPIFIISSSVFLIIMAYQLTKVVKALIITRKILPSLLIPIISILQGIFIFIGLFQRLIYKNK